MPIEQNPGPVSRIVAGLSKQDMIATKDDIVRLVVERGFLPFFRGEIADFSLEEVTPAELWFPDDELNGMGVWDYKSDIILDADCAYGKFYRNKACFVSMEWFPDLVNYSRSRHHPSADDQAILATLREHRSLLSHELKRLCGYVPVRKPRVTNPLERAFMHDVRPVVPAGTRTRQSFDAAITRLQMAGYVVSAAFEYRHDKRGRRYGWGVARYCTPEDFFGAERMLTDRTPAESRDRLLCHLSLLLPHATSAQIERIIE